MTSSKSFTGTDHADDLPQALAAALMTKEVGVVDTTNATDLVLIVAPLREVVQRALPEVLFTAIAPSREERAHVYGPGNEDIDIQFRRLTEALASLAARRPYERSVLYEGETVLANLVRGTLREKAAFQRGVNPDKAASDAILDRSLRALGTGNAPANAPASPNEIDAMQSDAISSYQLVHHSIPVLRLMLSSVRTINRYLHESPSTGDRSI